MFYKHKSILIAVCIGVIIGMMALIRPTEIIAVLIPILWGISLKYRNSILERLQFLIENKSKLITAAFACLLIGSIQLFYWKYAAGEWIVYSYQDQGFSWLRPHLLNGLFSYKSGWLTYSPLMAFSVLGFIPLWKMKSKLFTVSLVFFFTFIYLAFAWDIWWYGGSLGQRTMVQAYPVLMIPLCSFFDWLKGQKAVLRILIYSVAAVFSYLNIWFTHQAHKGGQFHAGQMTKAYYWKTLGSWQSNQNDLKLLDTDEYFNGKRKEVKLIFNEDFLEIEEQYKCINSNNVESSFGLCLNEEIQSSPKYLCTPDNDFEWIRVEADFSIQQKEWDIWKMTQFIVKFRKNDTAIKSKMIRLHRILKDGESKSIHIDLKKPDSDFDQIEIQFWNADSDKEIQIQNLKVESYFEE